MDFTYIHIIPECNADTNLVQTLLRIKGANHQHSCGQVTNEMQKRFKDDFAIGVIDLDKDESKYSGECEVIASSNEFSVCRHPNSNHFLIKIHNILECFIMSCASEVGVDLSPLGLPFERGALMKRTKKQTAKNDPQLSNFFKKIAESTEMKLLKDVLEYLDSHKYSVKEEDLIEIFRGYGFMLNDSNSKL